MTTIPWAVVLASYVDYVIAVAVAVLCVIAVLDCVRHSPVQFQRAWKRTKNFWLGLTGAAAAVSVFGALMSTLALARTGVPGVSSLLLMLIAATIAGVYLADVRPALRGESRNPGYW